MRDRDFLSGSLALLTFAVFGGSLDNDFVNWDDYLYIHLNHPLRAFDFAELLRQEVVGNYHPVTMVSLALEYAAVGLEPFLFHLDNLLLHVANALLVVALVRRLVPGDLCVPLLCGALFAVHPVQVETVAWIASRKGLLSGFFFLAALLAYLRFCARGGWRVYGLCLALGALALLSKPMAISLPLVMLALDHRLGRGIGVRTLSEKLPFAAGAVALGLRSMSAQALEDPERFAIFRMDLWERLGVAFQALVFYLSNLFLPLRLSAYYDVELVRVEPYQYAIALAAAGTAGWLAWRHRGARNDPLFGALFFLVSLAPALKIVPFGEDSIFNDRYLYLPSVGAVLVFAVPFRGLTAWRPAPRAAALAGWGLAIAVFSLASHARVEAWRDSESFARDVLDRYPGTAPVLVNLGRVYMNDRGETERALELFEEAARSKPGYDKAWLHVGIAHARLGDADEAARAFERALALHPNDLQARYRVAEFYRKHGELDRAAEHYRRAIEFAPDFAAAYVQLARVRRRQGDPAAALELLQEAARRGAHVDARALEALRQRLRSREPAR